LGDRARRIFVGHGVGRRSQFALAPLALRFGIHCGEVAAVVPEDVEPMLSLGQPVVVDPSGRQLAVDPAHHPVGSHARHVPRSGSVRETVQGVERRVPRGEGRLLTRDTDREHSQVKSDATTRVFMRLY